MAHNLEIKPVDRDELERLSKSNHLLKLEGQGELCVSFEFSKHSKRVKGLVSKDYDKMEILIAWSFPYPPHKSINNKAKPEQIKAKDTTDCDDWAASWFASKGCPGKLFDISVHV